MRIKLKKATWFLAIAIAGIIVGRLTLSAKWNILGIFIMVVWGIIFILECLMDTLRSSVLKHVVFLLYFVIGLIL